MTIPQMKSFSTYIAESADRDYTKFLKNCSILDYVVDRTSLYIDDLEDLVYTGKPLDKFFKKYDKVAMEAKEFATKDHAGRWKIECGQANKKVAKYVMIKERYKSYADCFAKVLACIKKGDPQAEAIKKLVDLGKKHKYYDLEKGQYTVKFFDDINEKDILRQIDSYKGIVKLNGPIDFYVIFEKGKVKKFYF